MSTETMSRKAFESLDEYSCSVPSGVRVGKVWKYDRNAYRGRRPEVPESERWLIREYVRLPDGRIAIEQRLIHIKD